MTNCEQAAKCSQGQQLVFHILIWFVASKNSAERPVASEPSGFSGIVALLRLVGFEPFTTPINSQSWKSVNLKILLFDLFFFRTRRIAERQGLAHLIRFPELFTTEGGEPDEARSPRL
jgi:hypothetical protein